MLQALNEAVVHAKEPFDRPSAYDLVTRLIRFAVIMQVRRAANGPAAAGGHGMPPTRCLGFAGELTPADGELARMRPEDEHLIGFECPNNLPIMRQATERVGAVITGKAAAEVVPLTKRRR